MKKFCVVVSYDGTFYSGWQAQNNQTEIETIQNIIEKSIKKITKSDKKINIFGSGRTDSGVHAIQQVFHFEIDDRNNMSEHQWQLAINSILPSTIRILKVKNTQEDFHARYSAISKTYRYDIIISSDSLFFLPPMLNNKFWFIKTKKNIDLELLQKNLSIFKGEHDFTNFSKSRGEAESKNKIRKIHDYKIIEKHNSELINFYTDNYLKKNSQNTKIFSIFLTSNGFLYKMVRMIVGTSINYTLKNMDISHEIKQTLINPKQNKNINIFTAPACGLYLLKVEY